MRLFVPMILFVSLLGGCAANDVFVERQSAMESRLEQVMQGVKGLRSEIGTLSVQVQELRSGSARDIASEKEIQLKFEALADKNRFLTNRVAALESVARQKGTVEVVNPDGAVDGAAESIQAAYMKAFGLFSANSYAAAAAEFNTFIATYPESEYALNARYWLAESYYGDSRFKESIEAFNKTIDSNPGSRRAADAMLRSADAWQKLGDSVKSEQIILQLIEKYPGTDAAVKAGKGLAGK